jgi:D-alanyl-lipoteichoic acid acyltransferase DltB (MBOAT superfamily)
VISGPIARSNEIVHQFGQRAFAHGWERRCALAATFVIIGLLQKMLLADPIADAIDPIYTQAASGPVPDGKSWLTLFYAFQVFFDFSGYSDVAIGVALVFGVELPRNFNAPFRATSISDFWRRWHMSLSRWLRDYVFEPLALGLRDWGLIGISIALLVTFFICGLWHGANWTFVIWGTLHGVALGFAVLWRRFLPSPPRIIGWALTIGFVMLVIVFFRADTPAAAWRIYQGLATLPTDPYPAGRNAMIAAVVCALAFPPSDEICRRLTEIPRLYVAVGLAAVTCLIFVLMGDRESYQFVYFQF